MALVMGSPVRVAGTGLAIDVSGTIKVWPYTTDPAYTGGFPFAFSTLGEVNCHVLGGQVGLRQTYQSGVAESGESRWQWYAQVAGGADGGPLGAAGPEQIYRYLDAGPGSEPEVQLADLPLTAAWQLSYSGLVIKRRHGVNVQPKRAHLHPRDTVAVDDWYLTPDFQVTASIGGVSFTSPARRAWPEFEGLTEAEIGDAPAGDLGVGIAAWMDCWRTWSWGYPIVEVTVSGVDFSGYRFRFAGGDSGSSPDGHLWLGEGSRLVAQALTKPLSSVSGASGHATAFLPIQYTWDLDCRLFDGGDAALDPDVAAGYLERVAASPGCQIRPRLYRLSELPDGGASIPPVQGGPGDETDYCAIPFDPHGNIPAFGLAIDETWALRHWLCPGGPVEYIDGAAIEDNSDRYITLYVPGVNAGVVGGTQDIGSVVGIERACLPLAPGRGDDPERRWTVTGQVAEAETSTRTAPLFTVPAGGGGTASYQPVTRMWDRLALIGQLESGDPPTAVPKSWDWPWHLKAAAAGEDVASDPPDDREPQYAEDVFHWGGGSYLRLRLRRRRPGGAWGDDVPAAAVTLTLDYSTISVYDPHYTCGSWRIEEWEYTRSGGRVTYSLSLAADQDTVHVDLLCPDDGSLPRLYVVDQVTLGGLAADGQDLEVELTELALENDPGRDHTGRDASAAPRVVGSVKETWDFLTDWQGMSVARDGNCRVLDWPDEPWRNQGPERGRGYIQPLQHCPTYSGPAGWLHYARPVGDLGAASLVEGLTASVDADALVEGAGPGGVVETLAGPLMYWGANHLWQTPAVGETGITLPGSVHVASWMVAKNYPAYVIYGRKRLGGAAWGLLRTADGRRRITTAEAAEQAWVIWRQVTAYLDADGDPIDPPAGAPAIDHYELVDHGALADRVDQHGLFRTPGLPPSRSRIWHDARGDDPSAHTDTADVLYLVQVWRTAGDATPWTEYDLDDPDSYQAMLADERLGSQAHCTVATRRLTTIELYAATIERGGLAMVYTPWGTTVICRGAGLRWPTETGTPTAGLLVDRYSQWEHGGALPAETVQVDPGRTRGGLLAHATGGLRLAVEDAGDLVLMRTDARGAGGTDMQTLSGHTDPALVTDPHTQTGWLVSRRTSDRQCVVHAVRRPDGASDPDLVEIATLGVCDPGSSGLAVLPDGAVLVARVEQSTIHLHRSRDGGRTWDELTA